MPYKNPDFIPEPEAAEYRGFCVYVPDYAEYRAALLGALGFFGTWTAWERDAEKSAKKSAALWREAHAMTVATWGNECGCDDMCNCDQIRDIIREELENMAINNCITVNCGGGGGCGCGGSGGNSGIDTQPPIGYEEPIEPLPEPDKPPETASYLEYKCAASFYLHYQFRAAILNIQNLITIGDASYQSVSDAISDALGWAGSLVAILWQGYYNLVTAFVNAVLGASVQEMVNAWDSAQQQVTCALFSADGVNEARAAFRAVIDNLNLPWASRYAMRLLEQNIDYAAWLYPENWQELYTDIPASFRGRGCCGQSQDDMIPPDEDMPENYILVPVKFTSVTDKVLDGAASMIADFSGNTMRLQHGGATGSNVFRPRAVWNVNLSGMNLGSGVVKGSYLVMKRKETVGSGRYLELVESWGTNTETVNTTNDALLKPILVRRTFDNVPAETESIAAYVLAQGGRVVESTAAGTGNLFALESTGTSNPLPISANYEVQAWLLVRYG